jgi:hypothetical protein
MRGRSGRAMFDLCSTGSETPWLDKSMQDLLWDRIMRETWDAHFKDAAVAMHSFDVGVIRCVLDSFDAEVSDVRSMFDGK